MAQEIATGGFLFGKSGIDKTISNTKSSESSLIKSYEEYEKISKKYSNAFKEHTGNLKKLDDYANIDAFEKIFKKLLLKEEFKKSKVNRENPLFLKNYPVEKDVLPSKLRKEHILQQVRYIMQKSFSERDLMFIRGINADVGKDDFILYVITIDNSKKNRKIDHHDYIISGSQTKHAIKEILSSVKKHLRRDSGVISINSARRSSRKNISSRRTKRTTTTKNSSSRTKTSKLKTKRRSVGISSFMRGQNNNSIKSKKPNVRKISLYMTDSEKKKAKEIRDLNFPQAGQTPYAGEVAGVGAKAIDLLAQPGSLPIISESAMTQQTQPTNTTPEDPVCGQHKDYESCKASGICYFNSNRKCVKKESGTGTTTPATPSSSPPPNFPNPQQTTTFQPALGTTGSSAPMIDLTAI